MKTIILSFVIMGLAASVQAASKEQLNNEIQTLTDKFTSMQQSDNRVPEEKLAAARGIILLDVSRGGFIFGYHSGYGVALAKDENGRWSAPAFVGSRGASFGAEAGGQNDFDVILLMNTNTLENLAQQQNINFGAGIGGTGGSSSANAIAIAMARNDEV